MNTTTINGTEWEWQPDMASWTNDEGQAICSTDMQERWAADLLSLLKRIEWCGQSRLDYPCCPECKELQYERGIGNEKNHKPTCALHAHILRLETEIGK